VKTGEMVELAVALQIAARGLREAQSMAVGLGLGVCARDCAGTAAKLENRIESLMSQVEVRKIINEEVRCDED